MALRPDRRETLAALLAGLACARPAAAQTAPVELILSEARSRYFLPVRMNAAGEASFLLDTGSPVHIVSESLAARADLRTVGRRRLGAYDGGGESPIVRADQFNVGGLDLGPTNLVVWPDARLGRGNGLLGYPLLSLGAAMSLATNRLTLRTPWGAAGTNVSAEVTRDGAVLLGGLPGADGRFAFDTGAQELTISPAYHQRILTNPAYVAAPKIFVLGEDGRPDVSRVLGFRPEAVRFGDLVCTSPLVRIGRSGDGRDGVFQGVDGLVGVGLLRRYTWSIEPGRIAVVAETRGPAFVNIPAQGGASPIEGVTIGAPEFEPAPRK